MRSNYIFKFKILYFGLLFFILLFAFSEDVGAAAPTDGLLGYWKFEENADVSALAVDSSGNYYHGILYGASRVAGKLGNALSFDGMDDYVAFSLPISNSFTIALWVKPEPGSDNYASLLWGITGGLMYKGDLKKFTFYNGGDYTNNTTITESQWTHVAVVKNGDMLTYYINGVADGTVSGGRGCTLVYMGNNPFSESFKGLMDEVRVYNRTLSALEIQDVMTDGGAASSPPPPSDTAPPSVPQSLYAIFTSPLQINLSWNVSTDNVGVVGYQLERCQGAGCSNFVQVYSSDGISYSDASLMGGFVYRYRVKAVDGAGNASPYSSIAEVGVPSLLPVLEDEEWKFLSLINNYRIQNSLESLQVSATLENAAQWISSDMNAKGYLSHTDSLGRKINTRLSAFGYPTTFVGENLLSGFSTAQGALTGWQNACDPDANGICTYAHRMNMLNPNWKAIGIGKEGVYWATDFGNYVDILVSPPSTPPPPVSKQGDLNGDNLVNSLDLSLLTSKWNQNYSSYDLNKDGIINSLDYTVMVQNWSL